MVATVAPLCVLQARQCDRLGDGERGNGRGRHAEARGGPERAAGLALPAMAASAGSRRLAATRLRAWPVLLAGLLTMAVADGLGVSARTVALIGADRILHGLAAGVAMPAALALAWERSRGTRQLLAALWASAAVTGLTAAITAALCTATAASALSGVGLLLAGLMTGYLAVGSVQVRMVMRLAAAPGGPRGPRPGRWPLGTGRGGLGRNRDGGHICRRAGAARLCGRPRARVSFRAAGHLPDLLAAN